jgi:UDP-N-acetyl-D-glucosamine dehydrogenase
MSRANIGNSNTEKWNGLLHRIENANACVIVMGLGYVGLPLALAFARRGFQVVGFDVNRNKVSQLMSGHSYVLDVRSETLREILSTGKFEATSDIDVLSSGDVIIICVPTPFAVDMAPDLSYIENAARAIADKLKTGQMIVLESTTYPGTTEELLVPILESKGKKLHKDFEVAFSPERIDPGNPTYHVENTPKVIGGLGKTAGDLASALYGSIVEKVVRVDSPREAEMAKLIENTFRQVNIALANELALISERMGVDIWQAIDAAASKPFGFMPFYPGPGVGGHCIPIDPHYLAWKAREMGCEISFIELAEKINRSMPAHVVRLITVALAKNGKSMIGAKILLLGVSYKRDIDDLRESPALAIIEQLQEARANVLYHDPYVPNYSHHGKELRSVDLTAEVVAACDCVVLVTDHSCFDKRLVVENAQAIVDTRNAFRDYKSDKIIRI